MAVGRMLKIQLLGHSSVEGEVKRYLRELGAVEVTDVSIEETGWCRAAQIANHLSWTRDPFDRMITAHALSFSAMLCTRDGTIREHYQHAFWG